MGTDFRAQLGTSLHAEKQQKAPKPEKQEQDKKAASPKQFLKDMAKAQQDSVKQMGTDFRAQLGEKQHSEKQEKAPKPEKQEQDKKSASPKQFLKDMAKAQQSAQKKQAK